MSKGIPTKPFSLYNNYYDLLYHDKDYEKESDYVVNIFNSLTPHASNIIDLGCGTGNYAKHLSDRGLKITGVEISEEMVAVAKSKAIKNFNVITSDISTFELDEQFDGAVALFHVVSYLTENKSITDCFKQVYKHLKADSLFIFDVWYTPAVLAQFPQRRTKQINTGELNINRTAEPTMNNANNTVDISFEMKIENRIEHISETFREMHTLRHFSTFEIKSFAHLAGFRFVRAEEFLTGKKPGVDTWGVSYILQKP
jgi:SAM-dependent methyltransferase